MISSSSDYFTLFGLAPSYRIDGAKLAAVWRELQRVYHPDRFAGKGEREVRRAVQAASLINQAYDVLKSPVKRAYYLLEMKGVDVDRDSHITRDMEFLMAQMTLRERLQEVEESDDPFAALEDLRSEAESHFSSLEEDFMCALETERSEGAAEVVAKMQFYAKFLSEIDEAEERLDS